MHNLENLLREAGSNFSKVLKTSIFLKDMEDFAAVNAIYASYFEDNFPARETIQVSRLPKDANVEISMIAYK
jgi:2-iminobutanoate/2-iminopropanoate deaminase